LCTSLFPASIEHLVEIWHLLTEDLFVDFECCSFCCTDRDRDNFSSYLAMAS
jgi:hypothetical protein